MSTEHDVDLELKQFLQKNGSKPVTFKALHAAMEDNIDGFMKVLKLVSKGLEARLTALENAHVSLEKKALKAGATWQRGAAYGVNDTAVHDGSIWRCIEAHTAGESFAHDRFVLQVKRGRDGKDLR